MGCESRSSQSPITLTQSAGSTIKQENKGNQEETKVSNDWRRPPPPMEDPPEADENGRSCQAYGRARTMRHERHTTPPQTGPSRRTHPHRRILTTIPDGGHGAVPEHHTGQVQGLGEPTASQDKKGAAATVRCSTANTVSAPGRKTLGGERSERINMRPQGENVIAEPTTITTRKTNFLT